ncbi:MAG: hypothetical protein J5J00_08320 [Deltaproteobacteria bacterium]|nr:hypothetical protein [Deltaproteobacteria bacterium]
MVDTLTRLTLKCLRLVLRPIARFSLQRAINIQDLVESLKFVLISVAKEELEAGGEKPNVSKLSIMTGMHRRDVMRILASDEIPDRPAGLTSRIIGQWEQDSRFTTKAGVPRVLTVDGEDSEFAELVKLVSKDLHPGTILHELERLGVVEHVRGGVRVKARYESARGDPEKGYQILGADLADLINAADENVFGSAETPNLHARTEYDNIFVDDLPKIREWLLKEGSAFHQKARNYLSRFDKDINPHIKKDGGARVVLGTYSLAIRRESDE